MVTRLRLLNFFCVRHGHTVFPAHGDSWKLLFVLFDGGVKADLNVVS